MTVLPFPARESSFARDATAVEIETILSKFGTNARALFASLAEGTQSAEGFERSLAAVSNAASCAFMRLAIESVDEESDRLVVDGNVYHRIGTSPHTMLSSFGPVWYERSRYRRRGCDSVVPADLRFGLINGFWSPLAARRGTLLMGLAPAGDCVRLSEELGGMSPSATALNHLVETVGEAWNVVQDEALPGIRADEDIPAGSSALSISLDGVMLGMRNEKGEGRQGDAAATGFREASCGAVSLLDADGERIRTVYSGRMPEAGKATLKRGLLEEAGHVLHIRPDLEVVVLADGAADNWNWFSEAFPEATEILDFWHAAQHLKAALDSAYGTDSMEARRRFERLRGRLRDEEDGVERIVRALRHLASKHPRRKAIARELAFFRKNRQRMRYAAFQNRKLPIGSGVVEAANKVLVTQRLKCSGMRWKLDGTGQYVLSVRTLWKSHRFEAAWSEIMTALEPPEFTFQNRNNVVIAEGLH